MSLLSLKYRAKVYSNTDRNPSSIDSRSNNRRLISIQLGSSETSISSSANFFHGGGKFPLKIQYLNKRKREDTRLLGGRDSRRKCPAPPPFVARKLPFLDSRHDRGTIYDAAVPPSFEKGGSSSEPLLQGIPPFPRFVEPNIYIEIYPI